VAHLTAKQQTDVAPLDRYITLITNTWPVYGPPI